MKKVVAVEPYTHSGYLNFKKGAYDGWVKAGGMTAHSNYPWRCLHGVAFRWELPSLLWLENLLLYNGREAQARLRFMEPVSMRFDTFPDYATHEIIPFVWDCWPCYVDETVAFLKRYSVKTAFFTSSQTAEIMRQRLPDVNVIYCPEGVDASVYKSGCDLKSRGIDVLEFGRQNREVLHLQLPETVIHSYRQGEALQFPTNEALYNAIADAKITIALPRSVTQPSIAGGIETLTQRYLECMLSRTVMLGHAPKELVDFVGYNPVIEVDVEHVNEQILYMLAHIEEYQLLVDRNHAIALSCADWEVRMRWLMERLQGLGYTV